MQMGFGEVVMQHWKISLRDEETFVLKCVRADASQESLACGIGIPIM